MFWLTSAIDIIGIKIQSIKITNVMGLSGSMVFVPQMIKNTDNSLFVSIT